MPRRCRVAQVGAFEMVKTAPSKREPEAQAAVERVFASTGLRFDWSTFPPGDSWRAFDLRFIRYLRTWRREGAFSEQRGVSCWAFSAGMRVTMEDKET